VEPPDTRDQPRVPRTAPHRRPGIRDPPVESRASGGDTGRVSSLSPDRQRVKGSVLTVTANGVEADAAVGV